VIRFLILNGLSAFCDARVFFPSACFPTSFPFFHKSSSPPFLLFLSLESSEVPPHGLSCNYQIFLCQLGLKRPWALLSFIFFSPLPPPPPHHFFFFSDPFRRILANSSRTKPALCCLESKRPFTLQIFFLHITCFPYPPPPDFLLLNNPPARLLRLGTTPDLFFEVSCLFPSTNLPLLSTFCYRFLQGFTPSSP